MSWQQVKKFDQAKAGKIKNFCLANVTKGYGVPNKYASAWESWQNTKQHQDGAPLGVDVPVYFSYTATIDGINKNWGHIGVSLANGKFWSDGVVYPSIGIYTAGHSPKYVGWGESVNGVKVITKEKEVITRGRAIRLLRLTRRGTDEKRIKALIGQDEDKWLDSVYKASWFKDQTAKINNGVQALKEKIINLVKGA